MRLVGHTTIRDYRSKRILFSDHNVITTTGKQRAAELLGGISAAYIDRMAVGDGGADSGAPSAPFIPLATDTGLATEILRVADINPTIIGTNQLRFQAIFLTSPPLTFTNPAFKVINEVGLFLQDDIQPGTPRMFARNTFPSIPFDTTDREGVFLTWTVTIV